MVSNMAKSLISVIKLKIVINPNPFDEAAIFEINKIAFFVQGFTKKKCVQTILASPRTILQNPFFYMSSSLLTGIIVAQPRDVQYIIFLNISNREIKRRFRSIDPVVENFVRCQMKIIGACMYHWTSCACEKLCMNWAFIHIVLCYSQ